MKTVLKRLNYSFKQNIFMYLRLVFDRRTPSIAKILLGLALVYLIFPFDVITDIIPILGQIDDLIIVPILLFLAFRAIPQELVSEYKKSNH